MICWLDQDIRYRRASGVVASVTPLDLTEGHGGANPIVDVDLGHPAVDAGFIFLMRDLLQIAFPPASVEEWIKRLVDPPTPGELRAAFEPYRAGLILDHPETPMLQVRPSTARLAEVEKPSKKPKRPPADEDEEDGDEVGDLPISALLPEPPTPDAVRNDADFFVKRDAISAIGAGAAAPALYAHMVLFPPGAGGYFGLPHGADSIKYMLVGRTLWETLWLNVLVPREHAEFETFAKRPPAAAEVFPWLDRTLADMPLGRKGDGVERPLRRIDLHPASIPMPRRYRLSPAEEGRCDLTGTEGPVFRGYSRWPKGLRYEPPGWWFPPVSSIDVPDPKPGQGPRFARARGPLRFDDWLETALFSDDGAVGGKRLPHALRQWDQHSDLVTDALDERGGAGGSTTAFSSVSPFRVRAFAQYPFGKAVGGFSVRELPIWLDGAGRWPGFAASMTAILRKLYAAGGCLAAASRAAVKLGRIEGAAAAADDLRDTFLADLDARVTELPAKLARLNREKTGTDLILAHQAEGEALFDAAFRLARDLFDAAFPLGGGTMDEKIAPERSRLVSSLRSVLFDQASKKSGKKGKGAP